MGEQAVQPRHAHVRDQLGAVAHQPRRLQRLLGHGQVGRARADDQDFPAPRGLRQAVGDRARGRIVMPARAGGEQALGLLLGEARHQQFLVHRQVAAADLHQVRLALPLGVHHLREAQPLGALVIELGEAQLLEALPLRLGERLLGREAALGDLPEQRKQGGVIHGMALVL